MSTIEQSAGKLISVIQKEWGKEAGELCADESEDVMGKVRIPLKMITLCD